MGNEHKKNAAVNEAARTYGDVADLEVNVPETGRLNEVARNWTRLSQNLEHALSICGRAPKACEILCVSKTQSQKQILPLLELGVRKFGENRVQEALAKWPALKAHFPDIELHLIGRLQTNKLKDALVLFDVIETIDRMHLVEQLSKAKGAGAKLPKLFVQINVGEESQKAGIAPSEADHFVERCRKDYGLSIQGLMCIPPMNQNSSPYFALLAKIARRNGIAELSMGMSNDFEAAVQLGSTEVRIGSGIFGARHD